MEVIRCDERECGKWMQLMGILWTAMSAPSRPYETERSLVWLTSSLPFTFHWFSWSETIRFFVSGTIHLEDSKQCSLCVHRAACFGGRFWCECRSVRAFALSVPLKSHRSDLLRVFSILVFEWWCFLFDVLPVPRFEICHAILAIFPPVQSNPN